MKKLFTLFSLLLISISGMLAANVSDGAKIYFDASEYPDVAKQKVVQLMIGHSGWSQGYKMDKVEGYDNIYLVTMPKWDGCTEFCFFGADALWSGESKKMSDRFQWMPAHTSTIAISSNVSGSVGFGGNPLKRTDSYQLPAKNPVINVGTLSQFPSTTVNETSTATVKYTVENSDETAKVTVEGEGFTAEDVEGTITITFAPTEAKEYTATLTIAIGDIKETVDLVATGVAADAPKVPEILNLAAGEIAEIFAGETTEFEVKYELQNAEEATASIEGEGFTIKKQEVGTATIEFAPTEAKTYEAVVTITSGEITQTLEISATAKKVPVVVTIGFVNPDWTEAALYAWVDGKGELAGAWPGTLMTKGDNGKFTYDLTIPEDGVYNFIINNNKKGVQSNNLPGVAESTCYVIETLTDGKFTVAVSESCEYQAPVEPEPIDPYVAIRGTMTDWTMGNDIKMTYNAEAANGPEWYITAFEVPEEGQFKVVSVDDKSQTTWYGSDKVDLQEGITNANADQGDADIALPAGKYDIYFKVNEGRIWIQKYVAPEDPKPSLTVSAEEVVFDELTLGDEPVSATATITYDIKNSDEAAVIALESESEVFKAEDENGTITITFAPEAEGEYTAELTITLGEIVKTIAISASAKAAVVPEPELEFALVGRLNGDNDTEILDYASGYKFTQESEFVYTLNVTFTGTITTDDGKEVQKVKLVDAEGNIWARNESKTIKPGDGTSTMTKGETNSSTYLQCEAGVEYKITYTLVSDPAEALYKLSGQITFEKVEVIEPEKPELIVSTEEVVFETLILDGEQFSSTETITYEIRNSDEAAVIELESEVFEAEDENGTITITFTPTFRNASYKATLTITLGDIVKTVAISAVVKPLIDDLIYPGFDDTKVGEYEEIEMLYSLHKGNEGEARIEGDPAFEITWQEVGRMFIKFTPLEVREYTATLIITSGKFEREITLIANGIAPDPEPVVITFVDEVTFPKTFVGETTNDIIEFTLENAAEDAEVVVEVTGEAFSVAEVQDNFIFLAFAPEAEGEYAGVLTVTVGEVSESLEFTAVASPVEPEPEPDPTPEYPKTITVKVACAWETCNIWAWYADESGNVYTEWPGEAMTKGEDGFYAIEMSIESPVYFKVNAGLGKTESENYMTELSESTCFNMNGLALVVNEDCEYEEPVKIEPYYGIRGLTGSWEMADEIKLTEDADKAEWYITNIEVDGTQEFKVVYVDETGAATWYGAGAVEANEALGKFGEGEENIKLAAGKYDIYFKVNEGMMWIQFSAETPTDVEDAAAELIYAVDGTIIAPAPFAIIDLAGKDVTKANGSLQGTYIVKTLNSVTKVSVQ